MFLGVFLLKRVFSRRVVRSRCLKRDAKKTLSLYSSVNNFLGASASLEVLLIEELSKTVHL